MSALRAPATIVRKKLVKSLPANLLQVRLKEAEHTERADATKSRKFTVARGRQVKLIQERDSEEWEAGDP